MSLLTRRIPKSVAVIFVGVLATGLSSPTQASESGRKNPTSKLYVADIDGTSSINTGEKIEDLTKESVHTAEGAVIQTDANSHNAIVLSNGTGISLDPDTRLEMRRFLQEPFSPNRTDLEVEPSVSQTTTFLSKGTVGLCTSKMVAGSTMTYNTRHASVVIRGRKIVVETNDNQTTVSLIEGDVTIRGELNGGGQTLNPGQQAIITRTSSSEPPVIRVQPIPKEDMKRLGEKVAIACMARKTVYFEVSDSDDYVPVQVVPEIIPPKITISPYKI